MAPPCRGQNADVKEYKNFDELEAASQLSEALDRICPTGVSTLPTRSFPGTTPDCCGMHFDSWNKPQKESSWRRREASSQRNR